MENEFISVKPKVNPEAEFFEILNDFSDPLEIFREAISNAMDWGANKLQIFVDVEKIEGERSLIIKLIDNGIGMTEEVISNDFWGLGFSKSREDNEKIGEKGHGTKIYLRSRKVHVFTQTAENAYEAICEKPLANLSERRLHEPAIRQIDRRTEIESGTAITIYGYNSNESSKFIQPIVKDYILWFTKQGSIESEFGEQKFNDFQIELKCIDVEKPEVIPFGHVFPKINDDLDGLFSEYDIDAADRFVKKYLRKSKRLTRHPEVTYDAVIYVEGDEAKRQYNPMIRARRDERYGRYKVSDRYGIWLCKDFIPVQRVNEWITGFGSGSNAFVLLHGFINCQSFKLTANRGNISNTDPQILDELKEEISSFIDDVDTDLKKNSLYVLRGWQEENRTIAQEKNDFESRVKRIKEKKFAIIDNQKIPEPFSESELFGVFMRVYALHPDLFEFEPMDYNTTRGIDIIARTREEDRLIEGEYGYVELKKILKESFNHGFKYLKWIICWDIHPSLKQGTKLSSIENEERTFVITEDEDGHPLYFIENNRKRVRIQVVPLKQLLKNKLEIEFNKVD